MTHLQLANVVPQTLTFRAHAPIPYNPMFATLDLKFAHLDGFHVSGLVSAIRIASTSNDVRRINLNTRACCEPRDPPGGIARISASSSRAAKMRRQIASGAIGSSTGSVGFASIECIDAGPMPPIS